MTEASKRRLELAIRLERLGLWIRWGTYFLLLGVYWAGHAKGETRDLVLITAAVFTHNLLVHVCFWRRRFDFFSSAWNFLVYLAEASVVVKCTGAEESPLNVLYIFLIAGYTVHTTAFGRILAASFACTAAFALVMLHEWWFVGIRIGPLDIFVKLATIPFTGWLVATLVQLREKAEETSRLRTLELGSSEAMLRAILDSTAQPILVYNERESMSEANRGAVEFLGKPREAMLGGSLSSVFGADAAANIVADTLAHGAYFAEHQVQIAEGNIRTVELAARSFHRNKHLFMVIVLHDMTERHELQAATNLANAKLARLNRELQRVNELRADLLSNVTRRLYSPLSAIVGYLDLLLHDEHAANTPEQNRILQNCRRDATRVFELLDEAATTATLHSSPENGNRQYD